MVPWGAFRPALAQVGRKPKARRKSRAGRKREGGVRPANLDRWRSGPHCSRPLCRARSTPCRGKPANAIARGERANQTAYQVQDRLSFMRFLGPGLEERLPGAKTVWLCCKGLAPAGTVKALFKQFNYPARQGDIARGGQVGRGSAAEPYLAGRESGRARSRLVTCLRAGRTSPRRGHRRAPTRAGPGRTTRAPKPTRTTGTWSVSTAGPWCHVSTAALHDSPADRAPVPPDSQAVAG